MAASVPLRDYLRQRASWVWNQQGHAFDNGLSLQEETMTEMLLLRMAQDHAKHGLTVTMFTKAEEAKNGADWEWIVQMPGCELGLRVQAKRLYHKDKKVDYGGLAPSSAQASKLITRAGGRIPVYVFFNHDQGMNSRLLSAGGEPPYRGRSFWGCSVACAKKVQAAKSNKLSDLKKHMRPWHRLISLSGVCGAYPALGISPQEAEASMSSQRRQVIERIKDRNFMLSYLDAEDLGGVAILDFSDFRGN